MRASATRRKHSALAFTLLELLVVIGIIAVMIAFIGPALSPGTARSLEGAARQFTADLENVRQTAIAERTKTRLLLPDTNSNTAFGSDLALRSYTLVSFNKTAGTWMQRGKWTRLPQAAAFDPNPTVDGATEESIITQRKSKTTDVDNSASGTAATKTFTGAYVEFLANGSTSLDPASPAQVIVVADGIPDGTGGMKAKNVALRYRVVIDPLTGSARLK